MAILFISPLFSCKKFLDERSDKSLTIPRSVKELQGLLDRQTMNGGSPFSGEFASDNAYLSYSDWASAIAIVQHSYIWDANTDLTSQWLSCYNKIFICNVVLDALDDLIDPSATEEDYNRTKGHALLLRAFNFYELSQLFSPPYSSASATLEYGIPLRLKPDIEEKTVRSTVQETYDRIISDLKEAAYLLSTSLTYKTRGSKQAAFALLARTYLVMGDYNNAGQYAESCLAIYDELLNYQTDVPYTANTPFPQPFNREVLFHSAISTNTLVLNLKIDSALYDSYEANDIRKAAFFRPNTDGTYRFKTNYAGGSIASSFSGIATDEVYLIRAECYAREGNISKAMEYLNSLLRTRWASGTFIDYTPSTLADALRLVLQERRKELVFRIGLRWSDLRRLNLDANHATIIKRILGDKTYDLQPQDARYTFRIPDVVIQMSGIQQNP